MQPSPSLTATGEDRADAPVAPGRVLGHEVVGPHLRVRTQGGLLVLTPYTARTVRVRFTLEPDVGDAASLTVVAAPQDVGFAVEELPDRLVLRTDVLAVEIDRATAAFTWRDTDGGVLVREPAAGGKSLEPVDVLVSEFDENTVTEHRANVDGMRMEAVDVRQVLDRRAVHTRLDLEWADGEALYGLGSHEEGMLNLRGRSQHLYQQNMKAVVPVVLSTRGYGLFVDSTSLLTFHDDEQGSYLWTDVDDEMDHYLVAGPEFDTIVAELRALTGQAPMLPRWAFGYVQSKERYVTAAELVDVVREYRARELPLDCIVLDWMSWTGELWGQKTLDPERFPDPEALTADLHAEHAHLMVSIWPTMAAGGDDWREMDAAGLLLGNRATYDAFDPEARAAYWRQADAGLYSHGVDAWWCDCTEPFEADWAGPVKPEPDERCRINVEEFKRYLDPERINAYSLLHSEGIHRGQRAANAATGTDKRVVNLTRSSYLGQQRWSTITWSGDVSATWQTLRHQVADGVAFCATGSPYWTTDVGAFFVKRDPRYWFWAGDFDDGVDDLGYRELYLRWFQFGAFLPMFRSHGTDTPREVWRFGEPGEVVYDALVRMLRLRSRLVPYLYALAGWTTQRAGTMLRALAFDFRTDPAVHDVTDQFLLGPALMVSPVTRPQSYGPGSRPLSDVEPTRPVVLPAGTDWYDLWTDERLAGGQTVVVETPLDRVPVHVRAGSILPLGPVRQHVDEHPDAPLELHVWPGADGSFDLYEDQGDGYDYEAGAFSVIPVRWDDAARVLTVGARTGSWPGMPADRTFVVVVHGTPGVPPAADEPGQPEGQPIAYHGEPVTVRS